MSAFMNSLSGAVVMCATLFALASPSKAEPETLGAAYPILGVKLGQSVDEAKKGFEGDFKLEDITSEFEVKKPSNGASFSLDYLAGQKGGTFGSINMLTGGPQPATDGFEIRLTTPEKGSKVVAMTRTLTTATTDNVPIAAFLASLKEKYGEPSVDDEGQIAWLHDGSGKKVKVDNFEPGTSRLVEQRLEFSKGGVPTCWRQLSGAEYGLIRGLPGPYSYQPQRPDAEDCSGGLYVRYGGAGHLLENAQFLALDNELLVEDRAAMDARVLKEIENAPIPPAGKLPKL